MRIILTGLCVLLLSGVIAPVQANSLKGNPSPYLALHGDDPVNWMPWGEKALELARKENKLLFVSVGYFACHWCHVMQRESFADAEVAAILNKHFISVKVDRELNPVLDDRLMTFLQATAGRGGWPMNVFLTPDAHPLMGIIYRPKDNFLTLLNALQSRWATERDDLQAAAEEVGGLLMTSNSEQQTIVTGTTVVSLEKDYREGVMGRADLLQGGFNAQTRFPYLPQYQAFLNMNMVSPNKGELEFLKLTLDQMISQGLRDQVGGGFYRYTIDPSWETPHFEKMLYTNALIVNLLMDAAELLDDPEYASVAMNTLEFMDREMSASDGAFVASLSAVDDHDIEGGYYLWEQAELKKLLSEDDLLLVNMAWGMERMDSEEGLLPIQVRTKKELQNDFSVPQTEIDKRLNNVKATLLEHRTKTRVQPRDEKHLSGWNGLALSAFAKGIVKNTEVKSRGKALVTFLTKKAWDGSTLYKAVDLQGKGLGKGAFEDYAYVALGLIEWGIAAEDKHALQTGKDIMRGAWQRFLHEDGWRAVEKTLLPMQQYQRHIGDHTIPSAQGALFKATLKSGEDNKQLLGELKKQLSTATEGMKDDSFSYPTLIDISTVVAR